MLPRDSRNVDVSLLLFFFTVTQTPISETVNK